MTFKLATLVCFELLHCLFVDNFRFAFLLFLCDGVSDTLHFAILVKRVFMQAAFNSDQVHTSYINYVKCQDRTRCFG